MLCLLTTLWKMKHSQVSAQSEHFQALHLFLKDLLIYYLEVGVTESERYRDVPVAGFSPQMVVTAKAGQAGTRSQELLLGLLQNLE